MDHRLWSGHDPVHVAAASADGSHLAFLVVTGPVMGDLYVADLRSGEVQLVDHDVVDEFTGGVFDAAGERIVYRVATTASDTGWYYHSPLRTWTWGAAEPTELDADARLGTYQTTPDGRLVVFARDDRSLHVVEASTGAERFAADDAIATACQFDRACLAVTDDSRFLAWTQGESQGSLHLLELATFSETQVTTATTLRGHLTWRGHRLRFFLADGGDTATLGTDTEPVARLAERDVDTGAGAITGRGARFTPSPTERYVAYARPKTDGRFDVIVADLITSDEEVVTSGVNDVQLAWGPSDHLAALTGTSGFATTLSIWAPGAPTRLLTAGTEAWYTELNGALFSPDGRSIAYRVGPAYATSALHVIDVATGEDTIVSESIAPAAPWFSPDSRALLFEASDFAGAGRVFEYEPATRELTVALYDAQSNPGFSPDGGESVHIVPRMNGRPASTVIATWWLSGVTRELFHGRADVTAGPVTDDYATLVLTDGDAVELRAAALP